MPCSVVVIDESRVTLSRKMERLPTQELSFELQSPLGLAIQAGMYRGAYGVLGGQLVCSILRQLRLPISQ